MMLVLLNPNFVKISYVFTSSTLPHTIKLVISNQVYSFSPHKLCELSFCWLHTGHSIRQVSGNDSSYLIHSSRSWNVCAPESLSADLWPPSVNRVLVQSHLKVINKQSCVSSCLPGKVHPLLYDFFGGETSAYDPDEIRLQQEKRFLFKNSLKMSEQ